MTTGMKHKDWFVDEQGQCQPRPSPARWIYCGSIITCTSFLSDILDILRQCPPRV